MPIMKIWPGLLISLALVLDTAQANDGVGQTLQISTHFRTVYGTPSWLLIIRDVNTGRVLPYQFDIVKESNFWVAFTYGHTYRITASSLTFGPYAKIDNFCNLENGIITGQSMMIRLTGVLSPVNSYHCYVSKFKSEQFTIVTPTE